MLAGQRHWIELVNAQEKWTSDDAMLGLIPEEEREFRSAPDWPRLKALAFLNNNAQVLRWSHERLERGEPPDRDLLNPVLESVRLELAPRAGSSRGPHPILVVRPDREGWNRGSAALRFVVQRASYHFAHYVDWRLRDPAWPGATPGLFRVLTCPVCSALVACPVGEARFCSEACATDTGRLS